MHRRNLLAAALGATGAMLASARSAVLANAAKPEVSKVAYHLSDLDKVAFVLGNIQNHLDGMGGPDNVTIALVVHGPALRAFHAASASHDVAGRTSQFLKDGVELSACVNTMRAQNVGLQDLLPGFVSADKGGVVRLAELQSQGYAYLRP